MDIELDPVKDARNIAKYGMSLERIRDRRFEIADLAIDGPWDYAEIRYVATAFLGDRLHVACFCERQGDNGGRVFQAISLRRANRREVKDYEQNRQEAADEQGRGREGAQR
jgi:uncharacterized protein